MKYILVVIIIFGSSLMPDNKLSAQIEKIYFLKGKVGERDMAIKMLIYDEVSERHITYFFMDDKRDKFLKGKVDGNFWFFSSGGEENESSRHGITLKIRPGADGDWSGTWTEGGKSFDINLKKIVHDSISSEFDHLQYIKEQDPYQRYKLSGISFRKTKSKKYTRELMCDWYEERESGITFFRLRSIKNEINLISINAALETINLSAVQSYFSLSQNRIDSKIKTTISYLSNELLSFTIVSENTYSNLKTSQTRQPYNYDIKEARPIDLEYLLKFDPEDKKINTEDLEKLYKYRKEVFAPKLIELLNSLYPEKMKNAPCNLNEVDRWVFPAWSLTKKGISFGSFIADVCNVQEWAVLSYEILNPFLQPKYSLEAKK